GFKNIVRQEFELNKFITEEISKIPSVKVIGPIDPALRGGIVSFFIDGMDSHQIALIADEMNGVMIRSGQHCVHSWFNAHQIKNSVRVSLCFYNTIEEAKIFIETLNKIIKLI
ncbi:MAG: aminotransferase class V-fold PLP-dependent enzyme, partial [bacterium]|nr:aminotransferase class V-fold PLP-dependent enzyme [bacterium]